MLHINTMLSTPRRDVTEPMANSEDVISYIFELTNEQPPGTRIPSERDIAQHLGLARNSVRTTIQHLVSAGQLTTRRGSGMFIAEPKMIAFVDETGTVHSADGEFQR